MLRIFVGICTIFFGCMLAAQQHPVSVAIPPFQEIGEVPAGSGSELALFAAQSLDPGRYEIKLRLHLQPLLKENLWDDPQRLREVLQNMEAQYFMLGNLCKTGGDYEVCYFVTDRLGNVQVPRDRVHAESWRALKDRLYASLASHSLARPLPPTPLMQEPWWWPLLAGSVLLTGLTLFALFRLLKKCRISQALQCWQRCIDLLQACQRILAGYAATNTDDSETLRAEQEITTWLLSLKAMSQQQIMSQSGCWRRLERLATSLQQACETRPGKEIGQLLGRIRTILARA